MNDNELNEPQGGILSDPMDRRSALKKAAAAGAIAWTAPMILSSKAHAGVGPNGVCTPACEVGPFTANIVARDACDGEVEQLQLALGTANKIAILRVVVTSGPCPCSTALPEVQVYLPPGTLFYKNNGKIGAEDQYELVPPRCVPYVSNPSNNTSTNYPGEDNLDEFIVFDSGAVGDGWYTASGPVCVSVGCPDEVGGDIVWRKCNFNLCFDYKPAGAICTETPNLRAVFGPTGDCEVGCDPCRPVVPPTTTTTTLAP